MTNGQLAIVYILLAVPLVISYRQELGQIREIIWAVIRMTVQLFLVGLYLRVLFEIDSVYLNVAWILVMLLVADMNILKKSALPRRIGIVLPLLVATGIGTALPTALLLFTVSPEPWYSARFVVPLTGMVLGNSLRGNIIALGRFKEILQRDRDLYATRLLSGATTNEALKPVYREALHASLAPTIASIATIGLVALPVMMTGQLLGGAVPMTAIRYQIAIMLAILSTVSLAALLNLIVAGRLFIDDVDMPVFE